MSDVWPRTAPWAAAVCGFCLLGHGRAGEPAEA